MSRKGAKSRTGGRKLRSTGTKARTRVVSSRESQAALIKDLKARARDLEKKLNEALEQQTATSEVLGVISSSPGELEPVFQAMLEKAVGLCGAKFGTVFRFDGQRFHTAAGTDLPPKMAEFQRKRGAFQPEAGTQLDVVLRTKSISYSADRLAEGAPGPSVSLGGARSQVAVPMLKDDELVGAFVIYRTEVRPFTAKQIELVQNFAAQAVIAIEQCGCSGRLRGIMAATNHGDFRGATGCFKCARRAGAGVPGDAGECDAPV